MTGPVEYARATLAHELASILGPDVPVHPAMPSRMAAPCAILAEQAPLAVPSDTAGGWSVHLEVALVTRPPADAAGVARLDKLTDQVLCAGTLDITGVSYATLTAADGQTYLIARIQIDYDLTIERQ